MEYVTNRAQREHDGAASFAFAFLYLLWQVLKFPVVALMVLLAPIVTAALTIIALLAIVAAFGFEFSSVGPQFSFLRMMSVPVACMALICVYHLALRGLNR